MAELNSWDSALSFYESGDGFKSLGMLISPNTGIPGRDAPFGRGSGRFGDYQCGSAYRSRPQVDQVPFIGQPFFTGVLAHGGDEDAILEFDIAQFQG